MGLCYVNFALLELVGFLSPYFAMQVGGPNLALVVCLVLYVIHRLHIQKKYALVKREICETTDTNVLM